MGRLLCFLFSALALACGGQQDKESAAGSDAGSDAGSSQESCPGNVYLGEIVGSEPWCLPRQFNVDGQGTAPASLFVAAAAGQCSCDLPGRVPAASACEAALGETIGSDSCACELVQFSEANLTACITDATARAGDGWCYLASAPNCGPVGNAELLTECDPPQQRLRFLGGAAPGADERLFVIIGSGSTALSCQ
ncbi:MAG TPA: hypothetical protein VGP93_17035 [Polyangiaceae bacterium]|nr:hypothetical protein [Polyangiaceae bacterium]